MENISNICYKLLNGNRKIYLYFKKGKESDIINTALY